MNRWNKTEYKTLYNSWVAMHNRCCNPKHCKWKWYGARGISVCDEWKLFKGFMEWALNNGWKINLTIDRIDNNLDYCPENCQWLSRSDNVKKEWADRRIVCVR